MCRSRNMIGWFITTYLHKLINILQFLSCGKIQKCLTLLRTLGPRVVNLVVFVRCLYIKEGNKNPPFLMYFLLCISFVPLVSLFFLLEINKLLLIWLIGIITFSKLCLAFWSAFYLFVKFLGLPLNEFLAR